MYKRQVLRQREAARLLAEGLRRLLLAFARRIDETADLPVMAHTHIQPAEPTTLGYRLALYLSLIHIYRGRGRAGSRL